MQEVAHLLKAAHLFPDVAFTSRLQRCRTSQDLLLETIGRGKVKLHDDWRLNERHYGALTGMSKVGASQVFGNAEVRRWRRAFDVVPPLLESKKNRMLIGSNYDDLPQELIPRGESLEHVVQRVARCWEEALLPAVLAGNRVLVTGHGNSLRALLKIIEGISDRAIASLEVPNARALVYEMQGGCLKQIDRLGSSIETASTIL